MKQSFRFVSQELVNCLCKSLVPPTIVIKIDKGTRHKLIVIILKGRSFSQVTIHIYC